MKKTICIQTNRLTLSILAAVLVIAVLLYLTNGITNLFFAGITPEKIVSATVYFQGGGAQAQLTKEDIGALATALRKVSLRGESVRLLAAETLGPQYRVQMDGGITFEIACYSDHYIVNGRAYPVSALSEVNYRDILTLYEGHLNNREYFPREGGGQDG